MGPLKGVPKIVGIPVPCCDPSVVELCMISTLGPFQTLLREFEFKHWGATITIAGTVMPTVESESYTRQALTTEVHLCTNMHISTPPDTGPYGFNVHSRLKISVVEVTKFVVL